MHKKTWTHSAGVLVSTQAMLALVMVEAQRRDLWLVTKAGAGFTEEVALKLGLDQN